MLWIGLYLPRLSIEVFERTLASDVTGHWVGPTGYPLVDGTCLAICDRLRVLQVNAAASARGVHPGQKRATALALCPDLLIRSRDPLAEQQALEQLACWALQFTPRISLRQPTERQAEAGLLLDIEASLKLFDGLDHLLTRLRIGLQELGFNARIGCAPTATACWLFARARDGLVARSDTALDTMLADLPVSLLDALRGRDAALEALGARCFRDLVRLPRPGLSRRFGKALLFEMDQALGLQPEVLPWFHPPARFEARLELLTDVEDAESLVFAARRMLLQLGGWLAGRHGAVRRLLLEALHDRTRRQTEAPVTRIELRFALPSHAPDPMVVVLRERLALLTLPAPVHTLVLRCDEVLERASRPASLLPDPVSAEENLGHLVERLQARLGHDQVRRLVLAEDHRPESAYRVEPLDDLPSLTEPIRPTGARSHAPGPGPGGLPSTSPGEPARPTPRPLWLLDEPQPLTERQQRPWWQGPLKLLAGPERIEGGWWDGRFVERDYFIAENDRSQWVWIFRTRGGAADLQAPTSPRWFLQGIFG